MFPRFAFLAVALAFATSTFACSAATTASPAKNARGLEAKDNIQPRDGAMFRLPKGRDM
ncbi:MAG: hypothetical protein U0174_18900 [Polyangiaceae bacterium]